MLLNDFLKQSTLCTPDKTALWCNGKNVSYAQLNGAAISLSNGLHHLGVFRQDRVAVYLDNSIEAVIAIYGILYASAVFVIINPQVKQRKLLHILNDCSIKAVVTDNSGYANLKSVLIDAADCRNILITNYGATPSSSFEKPDNEGLNSCCTIVSFETFLKNYDDTSIESIRNIDIDLASLMYTSGSSGVPKGVMLTHRNMVLAVNSITQYLQNTPDDIILNYLPLSFDYGLYQVLMSVAFGGTLILEKAFVYSYQAIQIIKKYSVTGFPLVPAMAALLLQMKSIDKSDLSSIRYITNTGQALPPAHIRGLQELLTNAKIFSMYGLTECKRALYLPPEELVKRPESVGLAIPNTEVWLIDENGSRITTSGKSGELVIRGGHIMKGYWNLPQETAAVLKSGNLPDEKVLLSGDLFKMDEEGFFYFISRKDDMIKSGGERISPREIENVLHEIPEVSAAAVVAVPDQVLGNAVKAYIVTKDGYTISKDAVLKYCSTLLEHARIPKYIEFIDKLPIGLTGKVRKKDL
jgi:acyl-CoA synthetase (AMP-forming)/AMP-acid ligase II